jgi:NTP pyrophosphatase (non-canonical NTP hydrolase)
MNFEEYQRESQKTAIYPDAGKNFLYPVLGIAGESGEVADKVKKIFREKEGILDDHAREELTKELGDLLWYVSQFATEIGVSLDDVAQKNIEKTQSRMERDTLLGDGDNR